MGGELTGKSKGGKALADKMTPEERKAKWKSRVISQETRDKISKNSPGNKNPRTQKQKDAITNVSQGLFKRIGLNDVEIVGKTDMRNST